MRDQLGEGIINSLRPQAARVGLNRIHCMRQRSEAYDSEHQSRQESFPGLACVASKGNHVRQATTQHTCSQNKTPKARKRNNYAATAQELLNGEERWPKALRQNQTLPQPHPVDQHDEEVQEAVGRMAQKQRNGKNAAHEVPEVAESKVD